MKKIYTGKSLDELKALAISEIKELGVDEADIKITVVEEPVKKLFGKKGDYKIEVEFETVTEAAPAAADETAPAEAAEAAPAVTDADHTEKVAMAAAYLEKVLTALGVEDFKVNIIEKEDITVLDIVGEKLGIVIGRRGETLDALQYLTSLTAVSQLIATATGIRERKLSSRLQSVPLTRCSVRADVLPLSL